jgi:hypothetical protein
MGCWCIVRHTQQQQNRVGSGRTIPTRCPDSGIAPAESSLLCQDVSRILGRSAGNITMLFGWPCHQLNPHLDVCCAAAVAAAAACPCLRLFMLIGPARATPAAAQKHLQKQPALFAAYAGAGLHPCAWVLLGVWGCLGVVPFSLSFLGCATLVQLVDPTLHTSCALSASRAAEWPAHSARLLGMVYIGP